MSMCVPEVAPSYEEVYDIVFNAILLGYHKHLKEYSRGMENQHPEPYICQEVIDSSFTGGKRMLTKGVDNEERVKDSALLAATADGVREKVKIEVWEQIEPTVEEKAGVISVSAMKTAAMKAAESATGELTEKAFDKARDVLAAMLANGQDLPKPKAKKPEKERAKVDVSETEAVDADRP